MRKQDQKNLWLFLAGFFLQTIPGAMLAPILTLSLAARELDPALIGAFATLPALAYMVALPAAPALIRRFGEGRTFRAALLGATSAAVGIALADSPAIWAVLYAASGFAAGLRYTIAEAWVPAFAPPEGRGRAQALYQTILGAAMFAGSGVLLLTGVAGPAPRALLAITAVVATSLLWMVRDPAPGAISAPPATKGARAALALVGPVVLSAALLGGLFESGMSVALPLYGLAAGLSPDLAPALVTAMGLGSLAQYPFGYLADRYPWQRVVLGTAALIAASALLLPLAAAWPALLALLALLWGSAGGGLYTLAAIRNGALWRGPQLVGASVVTQFAYMIGDAAGPGLGGLALGLAPQLGLPALVGGAGLVGLGVMIIASLGGAQRVALAEPDRA